MFQIEAMFKKFTFFLVCVFIILSCAKRGTISGGDKDILPPKIISSNPKNYAVEFSEKTIRINFNEYVKLKDVQKQLIVSPPMDKQPIIMPQSGTSKFISIQLKDSLKANTTYTLNFGQSIVDNNEGNAYPQLKYVFSTGKFIDSLFVRGTIKDAYLKKTDNFVSVMLYEVNEKYNDSTIFKQTPLYVTNTLDSLKTFKIENIKAGKYKLFALKDKENNFKFNKKTDKIAFYEKEIIVPDTSFFNLILHKEIAAFTTKKPSQPSGNRLVVGYEGKWESTKLKVSQNNLEIPFRTTPLQNKDSIQIWLKNVKNDSISLSISNSTYEKKYTTFFKNLKKDTLKISMPNNVVSMKEPVHFTSTIPIIKWNEAKMNLFKKDSVKIPFQIKYSENSQEINLLFEKEENQKYTFNAEKGAFEDYLEQKSDSIKFSFETRLISDYGSLKLNLQNVKSFPLIVELTNANGEAFETKFVEKTQLLNLNC